MKNLVSALIASGVLFGCATAPTPLADARPVSTERIFIKQQAPSEEGVRAIFIRDSGLNGAANYQHLYIDGTKVASLDPGEKVEFVLPQGEHIFGVIPTDPFGVHTLNTIDQDLKPGKVYYYRILMDPSKRSKVQRFIP